MIKIYYKILLIGAILSLTACSSSEGGTDSVENETSSVEENVITTPSPDKPIEKEGFLLDTIINIKIYEGGDSKVLEDAFKLCEDYENKFSRTIETSEISQINNAGGMPVTVSDETVEILAKAIEYSEISNGAFDVTIGAVTELWDFKSDFPEIPVQEDMDKALETVGYENIVIEGNQVTLKNPNTKIDLGAIAKGYIADKLKEFLVENGVTSGIINLGGNVLTIGGKPPMNTDWQIGVQKPFADYTETVAILGVKDKSVVSSGIYERYFEKDDKIYHHILDPKTGYPVENDVLSVTVVTDKSVDGDCMSTTCFSLGWEKGIELAESMDNVEVIYVLKNGDIKSSSGIGKDVPIEYESNQ